MKIRNLFALGAALLSACFVHAQMVRNNYNGIGSMYANTPGVTEIGFAPIGYTGGAAQSAGAIGEALTSVVPSGSTVSLTTATPANITSLALTAGVWELDFETYFQPAASTSVTILQTGIGTTTATLPLLTSTIPVPFASFITAANVMAATSVPFSLTSGSVVVNITAATTYYLVAQGTFTVSTLTGFGWLRAKRIR